MISGTGAPADLVSIRRDLHAHPEIAFQERRTAQLVADELRRLGMEVTAGIGVTGVVGVIRGPERGPTVGLRADMDALPIEEAVGRPHRSTVAGMMHACGHDGHVAMLIGAARLLAARPAPDGTVVFVFQPAEEGEAGAQAMIDDGLIERFGIEEIYALHNIPGMPAGALAVSAGPVMASFDLIDIELSCRGGHAIAPHLAGDVIAAGSYLVTELQAMVARRLDPMSPVVATISQFCAGSTHNVLPTTATLRGTVRTLSPSTRESAEMLIGRICDAVASSHGVDVRLDYQRRYPVTINNRVCADRASLAAEAVSGGAGGAKMLLAAEDFAYMLERIPGAYVFIGNGPVTDDHGQLHGPAYDFNDEILDVGSLFLAQVARTSLAQRAGREAML